MAKTTLPLPCNAEERTSDNDVNGNSMNIEVIKSLLVETSCHIFPIYNVKTTSKENTDVKAQALKTTFLINFPFDLFIATNFSIASGQPKVEIAVKNEDSDTKKK
ncbi:hypothetical protein ABK16_14575 [Vibrio parahaemolyticus]|nr:hypothetical protein ABK16_14575 [Vibrio parahaemolyticus]